MHGNSNVKNLSNPDRAFGVSATHDVVNCQVLLVLQSASYDATITHDPEEVQIYNSDFQHSLILRRSPQRNKPKRSYETGALPAYCDALCNTYLSLMFLLHFFLCFPSSYFILIYFPALHLSIPFFFCYMTLHPKRL